MLQQTQVATALPYFHRWLETFPTFQALADADEGQVLKQWEGLGYYSRARNLHKLAKTLVELNALPSQPEEWQKLPGIGPYTAAAITSLEFGYPSAVVDGNVVRVLTRLTGDAREFRDSPSAARALKSLADSLLARESPGEYNQAIMELGATICRPKSPLCTVCPVVQLCHAAGKGDQDRYPRFTPKRVKQITIPRGWLFDPETRSMLLHKIPSDAKRLAGQYQIPALADLGLQLPLRDPVLKRKRGISNQQITEPIFKYSADSVRRTIPDTQWVPVEKLDEIVINGPHRKWIQHLLEAEGYPNKSSR